jgi:hypothetical protein
MREKFASAIVALVVTAANTGAAHARGGPKDVSSTFFHTTTNALER